jgi:hypothetical protein
MSLSLKSRGVAFIMLFTLCLFASAFHYVYFLYSHNISLQTAATPKGDAVDYIETSRNLIEKDVYGRKTDIPILSNHVTEYDKGIYYAFRTPGYVPLYFIGKMLHSSNPILFIILLELLLFSVAKTLLCLLVWDKTRKLLPLLGIALFINSSPFAHHLLGMLLTETTSFSLLVIGMWLLPSVGSSMPTLRIFLVALLLLEAVLLRPFLIPILIFPFFYTFTQFRSVYMVGIFTLPFILFFSVWIVRNYSVTGDFIPVATTLKIFDVSNRSFVEQRKICKATGEQFDWYTKGNLIDWFRRAEDSRTPKAVLPQQFFSSAEVEKQLLRARSLYQVSLNPSVALDKRRIAEDSSASILNTLLVQFKANEPVYYYIISSVKVFKRMVNVPVFKPFVSWRYPLNVLTVVFECFINSFVLVCGLLGCIFYFSKHFGVKDLYIPFVVLFVLIFFSVMVKTVEVREYFLPYMFGMATAFLYGQTLLEKSKYVSLAVVCLLVFFITYNSVIISVRW